MVLHMPLEGQALNMAVQRIPHVLDQGLAAAGVEHAEAVDRSGLDHGNDHNRKRHNPQIAAQVSRPAEGFQHGAEERAQRIR